MAGQGGHTFTDGVPDLNGLVSRSRDDLSQVLGDRHRQHVTGVADESLGAFAGFKVPQSEGLVPRGRQSVSTVSGDGDVLDDVFVTLERLLGNTVVFFTTSQLPGDQGLVSRTRKKQVGVGGGGGQRSDPAVVAFQSTSQNQNFLVRHIALTEGCVPLKNFVTVSATGRAPDRYGHVLRVRTPNGFTKKQPLHSTIDEDRSTLE